MEKYLKQRVLGQGAFGKVWLCTNKKTNKQYCLKCVEITDQERQMALKEIRFLNQLSHPHIVGYEEYFEEKARRHGGKRKLNIVMEYCDGPDLAKRIKNARGPIAEDQIIDWVVQICLALKHLHDRKILHRDLKSENIFSMNKGNLLKLGDFGISKNLSHTSAKAMTRIGTPYYLSPELAQGKPYNSKNDMWALGVIMYELQAKRVPFDAPALDRLMNVIVTQKPAPLPRNYSKQLRDLTMLLLSKNPAGRPDVHKVLSLPWISSRIQKFLGAPLIKDEFSHTVLHNNGRRSVPQRPPGMTIAESAANSIASRRPLTSQNPNSRRNPSTPKGKNLGVPTNRFGPNKANLTPSRVSRRPMTSPAQGSRIQPRMKRVGSQSPMVPKPSVPVHGQQRPFTSPQKRPFTSPQPNRARSRVNRGCATPVRGAATPNRATPNRNAMTPNMKQRGPPTQGRRAATPGARGYHNKENVRGGASPITRNPYQNNNQRAPAPRYNRPPRW